MTFKDRWNISLDVIRIMQDTAHRVVFKTDQPKFDIFEICEVGEGAEFDIARVRDVATRIESKKKACDGCVSIELLHGYGSTGCCTRVRGDVERPTFACEIFLTRCERIPRLLK